MAHLQLPLCEDDDHYKSRRAISEPPKAFAALGSYRQRHGEVLDHKLGLRTSEAPAKLESVACIPRGDLHNVGIHSLPNDCDQGSFLKLRCKPYHRGKSFSTDLDREEAWERKKKQFLLEEEEEEEEEEEDEDSINGEDYAADAFLYDDLCKKEPGDESSCRSDDEAEKHTDEDVEDDLDRHHIDDGHAYALHENGLANASKRMPFSDKKSSTTRPAKPIRTKTKSLTDDDMEELRGSIDLGFGFSYSERNNLKSTLPALELYYAINKNYVDTQSRSMPGSPLHGNAVARTNSYGRAVSPSNESWRISSPGDHPSQVKSRLRHWAQAVACSLKQGN